MHNIEPFYRWLSVYNSSEDELSPFYGKTYNYDLYSQSIYNHFIDSGWDFMGSETLYIKILYVDYDLGICVIEFLGEWNDALNNDIMHLKRNILDKLMLHGVHKFILLGGHILNFHGSDDCYYEEWFDEVEDGWIAAVGFHEHVLKEWAQYGIDTYLHCGGSLQIDKWRTFSPESLLELVEGLVKKRLYFPLH